MIRARTSLMILVLASSTFLATVAGCKHDKQETSDKIPTSEELSKLPPQQAIALMKSRMAGVQAKAESRKQAEDKLKAGDLNAARQLFEAAAKTGDQWAALELANMDFTQGQVEKSIAQLEKCCSASSALCCSSLSQKYERMGDFAKARSAAERLEQVDKSWGQTVRAWLERLTGNVAKAKEIYQDTCKNGKDENRTEACEQIAKLEAFETRYKVDGADLTKSCDAGTIAGCTDLAELEKELGHLGVAEKLYKKTCDDQKGQACIEYAKFLIFHGKVSVGSTVLEQACNEKQEGVCFAYANIERELGHVDNAFRLADKGCSERLPGLCRVRDRIALETKGASAGAGFFEERCGSGEAASCVSSFTAFTKSADTAKAKSSLEKGRDLSKIKCDSGDQQMCGLYGIIQCALGDFVGGRGILDRACSASDMESCTMAPHCKDALAALSKG